MFHETGKVEFKPADLRRVPRVLGIFGRLGAIPDPREGRDFPVKEAPRPLPGGFKLRLHGSQNRRGKTPGFLGVTGSQGLG